MSDHPETQVDTLSAALNRHAISLPDTIQEKLDQYCRQLWDWNSRLNLTRHTSYETFVTRDLLDTLHLTAHLKKGVRVLDIGSGGGVPGIPAAILRPDLRVSLCDSVAKKSAALQSMVQSMNLRIAVQQDRAENVLKRHRFDVVTARAVAPLEKLLQWFHHSWPSMGELLLIKGRRWAEEEHQATEAGLLQQLRVEILDSWETPGRDGRSVLVSLSQTSRKN